MARHLITLAALGLCLSGCVAQEKYNAMKLEADALREQCNSLQNDRNSARAAERAWKEQYDKLVGANGDYQKAYELSQKELSELKTQYAVLNEKYTKAVDQPINWPALPQPLSDALAALAAQHPGVVEFDANRGILKFKSDVTFAKGSADLTPQARQALGSVAQILNSPVAANYEMLVAGHTDSTPVSSPATIQSGHKDNWYLSAHRAISVSRELMSHQVRPQRIGAVGYGAERPAASNGTTEGQARNRRVEIVLLPTTFRGGATTAGGPAPKAAPAVAPRDLNKDTATIGPSAAPAFNK